ncbi:hypothetical protein G4B88_005395 [Cannabis sativa]|uniref:Poly(A) polymerase RNA-binding domain-containing protein n=1 Tax=Cannabis sativa TaxID=3483 RepID=A0A7J6HAV8_CANSA|nr:hypothetical protein G4B88_024259 [Cannabis sativa]KAF4392436.1 hypothetical protein G4B88_005395 [Cannabis sativa]
METSLHLTTPLSSLNQNLRGCLRKHTIFGMKTAGAVSPFAPKSKLAALLWILGVKLLQSSNALSSKTLFKINSRFTDFKLYGDGKDDQKEEMVTIDDMVEDIKIKILTFVYERVYNSGGPTRLYFAMESNKAMWDTLFERFPFFETYKNYLQIDINAENGDDLRVWKGWVESRLRQLTLKIHVCHVKRKNIPNFVFSDGVCAQPDKSDENKTVLDGANQGRKRRHNGENNIRNVKSSGEVADISSVTSSSMKCLAANIRYQNGDSEVSSSSSPPTKTSPKTLADKMDIEKVMPGSYAPHQAVLEELEDDLEHRNKVKSSENEAGVPPSATLVAPPLSNKCFASSVPHPKPIIRFIITSLFGRSS